MKNNNMKLCIVLICTFILGLQNNNSSAAENKIFNIQKNNSLVMQNNIDNTNEVNNAIKDYAKFISNAPNNNNPVMKSSTGGPEETSSTINNENKVIIFRPKAKRIYKNKVTQIKTIKIQTDFWSNQYNNLNKQKHFIQEINKDNNLDDTKFIQGIKDDEEKIEEYLVFQELKSIINHNNKNIKFSVKRPETIKLQMIKRIEDENDKNINNNNIESKQYNI